jgi:hypothetical protein
MAYIIKNGFSLQKYELISNKQNKMKYLSPFSEFMENYPSPNHLNSAFNTIFAGRKNK